MDSIQRDRLLKIMKERAVIKGHIKLSNGNYSIMYIDVRNAVLNFGGIDLVSNILLDEIESNKSISAFGCVEGVGSTLILGAMAAKTTLQPFVIRKERKEYGTRKLIEGDNLLGKKVVLIDDVITTGRSITKSIFSLEEAGAVVSDVMCVVDRGDNLKEKFSQHGYRFTSIFEAWELL